jgi:uncharacterized protein DUF1844
MPDEKQPSEGFKVVDRRLFGEDGKLRDVASRERQPVSPNPGAPPPPSQSRPPAPPPAKVSTPTRREPDWDEEAPGADFEMLISYLSTTAMFQLGLLPGPSGERIPADLDNARRTIDLLEVLEQKTRGNLTAEETRLLDDVLADLRMGYIEVETQLAKKPK